MELPKPSGGDFEITPAGTFPARCHRFIDIGSHDQAFQGVSKLKRLVMVGFELPTEFMEDGRPFSIHKRWTWSTHEKANMRKDLESWRGAKFKDSDFGPGGFDVKNLLGQPATISIVHTEKDGSTYANITAISKAMKGIEMPKQINPSVFLSLDPTEFDREVFNGLSERVQKSISESPEYQSLIGNAPKAKQSFNAPLRQIDHPDDVEQRPFAPAGAFGDMDDEIPFAPEFR